jgi:hypothetical protein
MNDPTTPRPQLPSSDVRQRRRALWNNDRAHEFATPVSSPSPSSHHLSKYKIISLRKISNPKTLRLGFDFFKALSGVVNSCKKVASKRKGGGQCSMIDLPNGRLLDPGAVDVLGSDTTLSPPDAVMITKFTVSSVFSTFACEKEKKKEAKKSRTLTWQNPTS